MFETFNDFQKSQNRKNPILALLSENVISHIKMLNKNATEVQREALQELLDSMYRVEQVYRGKK